MLRERVVDLEATVSAEAETAALVAPLALSLDRVAQQVHTLERDRGEQFAKVAVELARVQSSTGELRDQTASLVGSLASANVRGRGARSRLGGCWRCPACWPGATSTSSGRA